MKTGLLLLICVAWTVSGAAAVAETSAPELQKLDISVGHWVYHGQTLSPPAAKPGAWTWNEDCNWSGNREFMVCSFTNDWSGRVIKSLVVDTYNRKDLSYSHYELFNGGAAGARPFVSKMTIHGNMRIEYATDVEHGRKTETRITYVYDSPTHVKVKIETSRDGTHWVTVDQGEGVKQP